MSSPAISFWGGMALLISSITGPGLTALPLLYQQAGWFTPTVTIALFGALSGAVSLFLVETMSSIQGNEKFQARVEYSTVAHLYLGKKAHIIMLVLLYCALQSVNISSIIISEQTMDSLLIRLFHKTCALSFSQGWICASEIQSQGSPFDSYILFSFGYLISAALVLPLSVMSLVQNIKFQFASVVALFLVMFIWIYLFASHGLDEHVPFVGNDQSSLAGFVISNLAFITTVPSFINELSRHVSIHKSIAYPILVCVILYIIIGITGASSFRTAQASDILATLSASNENKVLIVIVNLLFPIAVLVTSVPVFAIVIRYNLVRGNICSHKYAVLWASLAPWILIIPFQTKGWLILVMNWTSLIFGSSTNFIIPLLLYLSSKNYSASTAEFTGGDLFMLHRDIPSQPLGSLPRSTRSARSSIDGDQIPLPESAHIDSAEELASSLPTAPLVVITRPSRSRRSTFTNLERPSKESELQTNIVENGQSSDLPLTPSTPVRVVYSPTASRSLTTGRYSESQGELLASNERNEEEDSTASNSSEHLSQPIILSGGLTSPNTTAQHDLQYSSAVFNNVPRLRRNSTLSQSSRSASSNRAVPAPNTDQESGHTEDLSSVEVFKAFPERKWFRSIVLAKCALAFTICCVLGDLIYTIVETARGQAPLGG